MYVVVVNRSLMAQNHRTMRPEQVRAARALLDWSQEDLAVRAGVRRQVINLYEKHSSTPLLATLNGIFDAFDKAGITFVEVGSGGYGVIINKTGEKFEFSAHSVGELGAF